MFPNIKDFLNRKQNNIKQNNWQKPIIFEWLEWPTMKKSLEVIDKKVSYLLQKNAIGKLKQWFLSDDQNFNSITAERYIIDYLKLKNENIEDNLLREGVDAIYNFDAQKVGIEITTINGFIADWIFVERLPMYLREKQSQFFDSYTVEIDYNYERIKNEMQKNYIYNYIQNVGENIILGNESKLRSLEVAFRKTNRRTGCISWNHNRANNFPIIQCYLTNGLIERLNSKEKQLSKHKNILIFVGVNHAGPMNWVNPRIFKEIGCGGISYQQQIGSIQKFLSKRLPQNVTGICYYNYALDREEPFYPLRIFWRNENQKIKLNL